MDSQPMSTNARYIIMKRLASITHANINIKGGNIFQDEIFKVIRDSNNHLSVIPEHRIELIQRENQPNQRKSHKVDIFIEDEDSVIAINSKGKSFNNTMSQDSLLQEYNWYLDSLRTLFPNKECKYCIFKDEYSASNTKMGHYHYINSNGIPVYNTENYLEQHYDCNFSIIENRRQERCIAECESALQEEDFSLESLYASNGSVTGMMEAMVE